ncbi:MAG TPA: glycosyltransferase family 1 protein [Bryobacteraceae bacterium]|jgi:glycosyltransferase involved in cell wall biosynthesis
MRLPARTPSATCVLGLDNISPGLSTGRGCIGGMRTYLQDLITHLPQVVPNARVKLFTPSWSPAFELPSNGSVERIDCGDVPTSRAGRVWFEQTTLPKLVRENGVDAWLGTCNTLPLRLSCASALIVQSLQFFSRPEAFSAPRRLYLQTAVPASVRRADAVVALSYSSRSELLLRFQVPERKLWVIPHCLHDVFNPSAPAIADHEVVTRVLGEDAPYILYVSALYPYKNHARLIEAFARIAERFPRHKLLIGGSDTPGWGRQDLARIAERFGVASRVILAGRLVQADMPALYRRAELLAMPSLDETFGLPVLEAMAFGCPVLTSNISSMSEVARDAAILVDPASVSDIVGALDAMLASQELRTSLSQRGFKQAALFTREKMMQKFGEMLASLLAPAQSRKEAA